MRASTSAPPTTCTRLTAGVSKRISPSPSTSGRQREIGSLSENKVPLGQYVPPFVLHNVHVVVRARVEPELTQGAPEVAPRRLVARHERSNYVPETKASVDQHKRLASVASTYRFCLISSRSVLSLSMCASASTTNRKSAATCSAKFLFHKFTN